MAATALFWVLFNLAAYILILPAFFASRPTYVPLLFSASGSAVAAMFFAWRSTSAKRNPHMRVLLCFISALAVIAAVVLLSLLVLVNVMGS